MISQYCKHTYCLRCRKPGMGCKCKNKDMTFIYSDKLRVPTSIKNKSRFRKFLDDCPIFVNIVEDHQRDMFIKLLRDIRYFNKVINNKEWTNIRR